MKTSAGRVTWSFVSIWVGLGLVVLVLLLAGGGPESAQANGGDVLYVVPGGTDSGPCTDSAAPCGTVQYAVDQAATGDEIRVATGTYGDLHGRPLPAGYEPIDPTFDTITQVVYISKTLTLRGGYNPSDWSVSDPVNNPTTLNAGQQGRVAVIAGEISPTVENLRLINGDATDLEGPMGFGDGGGLLVISATATISNNAILNNSADVFVGFGAGVMLYYSDSLLNGNTIDLNECGASGYGGGVAAADSDAVLSHNLIGNNVGGGLAGNGGGVFVSLGVVTLDSNIIQGNQTYDSGAGVAIQEAEVTLINNIVAENELLADPDWGVGSGISLEGGRLSMIHNTLSGNFGGDGSALFVWEGGDPAMATLTNTILVSHTVGVTVTAGNTVTLNSTLWGGGTPWANGSNWGGEGTVDAVNNYDGIPDFVGTAAGVYRIGPHSAAINKGVDAGITVDIDENTRPQGGGFDLGASEYTPDKSLLYLPALMKDK